MYEMVIKGSAEADPIVTHAKQRINLLKQITHMSLAKNLSSPGTFVSKSSREILEKERIYKSKGESDHKIPNIIILDNNSVNSVEGNLLLYIF